MRISRENGLSVSRETLTTSDRLQTVGYNVVTRGEVGGAVFKWALVDDFCRRCCVCAYTYGCSGRVGGEGIAPPPHDDDELLFKSRVILLFKIPIPKLLHARALALAHKEKGRVVDDLLFVCWLVCCVCVVLRRRYCYYGKHAGLRGTSAVLSAKSLQRWRQQRR